MWITLMLLATLCFLAANLGRDHSVLHNKEGKALSSFQLLLFMAAAQALLGAAAIWAWRLPVPDHLLTILATGWLYLLYLVPYFLALKRSDLTVTGPLMTMAILFSVATGWLTLGERPGTASLLGCVLMGAGSVAVCWRRGSAFRLDVLLLMLANGLLSACYVSAVRWLGKAHGLEPLEVFSWSRLGLLLFLPILSLRPVWSAASPAFRLPLPRAGFTLAVELANGIGIALLIWAFMAGPSTAVVTATHLSLLLASFSAGTMAVAWKDRWYREGRVAGLPQKLAGTLLILAGLWAAVS